MFNLDSDSQPFDAFLTYKIELLRELVQELVGEVETLRQTRVQDFSCGINIQEEIRLYERLLISRALKIAGGNQRKASQILGLRPTTLNYKIKRYKIMQ